MEMTRFDLEKMPLAAMWRRMAVYVRRLVSLAGNTVER